MSFDPICIDCMGEPFEHGPHHKAVTIANGNAICEEHAYARWQLIRDAAARRAGTDDGPFDAQIPGIDAPKENA